jgi:ABC-type lipoprotein export system ATPase subunit
MEINPSIRRYFISGLNYYQSFDFRFKNPTTILVGESGLGKTKILYLLYLALTRRWFVLAKQQFDFILIEFDNGTFFEFSKGELEFYLLSKALPNEFGEEAEKITQAFKEIQEVISSNLHGEVVYFPVYRDLKEDFGIIGKKYSETRFSDDFSRDETREATEVENDVLIPLSIAELFDRPFNRGNSAEILKLVSICNEYLIGVKMKFDVNNMKVLIQNVTSNEIVDLTQLSSGEKQLVYFFFKVYLTQSSFIYILFDEPELSIPIDWQKRLLQDLQHLKSGMFLLVITHSPFIFDNELDVFATSINLFKS